VRQHYISIEALRHANATIVNQIFALRDPRLWGEGHACASDGERFESWRQNLMTAWRSRYRGYGVLVYLSEASDKYTYLKDQIMRRRRTSSWARGIEVPSSFA